jgi:hypothetical protein
MVRTVGLVFFLVFAGVGALFLLSPEWVLRGMNGLARMVGMGESPLHGAGYFPVMAASYMAVVTMLAWKMFREPANPAFPLLLFQAKAASSLFSLGVFFLGAPHFILLANGILDGGIAAAAYSIHRSLRTSPGGK